MRTGKTASNAPKAPEVPPAVLQLTPLCYKEGFSELPVTLETLFFFVFAPYKWFAHKFEFCSASKSGSSLVRSLCVVDT